MKTDTEVRRMRQARATGKTQEQVAARTGMSVRTVRKYERAGALPSQLKAPRTYHTRPNPFADAWSWVTGQLARDPALQATTLFALLCDRHPGRYQAIQLRTLQRHIAAWRAQHGPEREVFFPQVHQPGLVAQSDFTHMTDLGITLGGIPFPHLLFHLVLTYSNVEAVQICPSESFEALAEGVETCLWQLGGVPLRHRTDHLSAAIRPLDADGRAQATTRYAALMAHYGMEPTTNTAGEAHENGDVEQAHYRFKQAVDQALRVRGSRDFLTRAAYAHFLGDLVRRRNLTRQTRFAEERLALRPLPAAPLRPCRELRVPVSRFSTVQVLRNTYSLPSRLIGMTVLVRVRAETLAVRAAQRDPHDQPGLLGPGTHLQGPDDDVGGDRSSGASCGDRGPDGAGEFPRRDGDGAAPAAAASACAGSEPRHGRGGGSGMSATNAIRDGWREGSSAAGSCVVCSRAVASGKARYCSRACQQRAYRLRQPPTCPLDEGGLRQELQRRRTLAAHTIYECPTCGERLLGERRCGECNRFCRALGLGGRCPECDGLILLSELLEGEVSA